MIAVFAVLICSDEVHHVPNPGFACNEDRCVLWLPPCRLRGDEKFGQG